MIIAESIRSFCGKYTISQLTVYDPYAENIRFLTFGPNNRQIKISGDRILKNKRSYIIKE